MHMPTHQKQASISSPLPARYTVPPMPPRIHRSLNIGIHEDGVVLSPDRGTSIIIHWGVKGGVEATDDQIDGLEIGGVLGIARLWDGASNSDRADGSCIPSRFSYPSETA
jgi:hypothetical protein